jgi:hypothetical protein
VRSDYRARKIYRIGLGRMEDDESIS